MFNDTGVDWNIHSGSVQAVSGTLRILRHSSADFDGPNGSDPFIKVWNGVVMVYFGGIMASQKPFARAQSALFEARWRRPE